ncbi:HAD-IA family hydrolase [Litchfieldia alkalitelluris]|uniref:HAD-IA family hydrolase n=1 Tax=Litchfieldia alkalitelluris TaxID=304268 RepID=UPI00099694FE|nr:HAD-IA family hydrolase [Litchfieldia alkalitelluris]
MNILWDFDGTLFDTYPVFTDLFSKILSDGYAREEIYKELKVSFSHATRHFNFSDEQISYFYELEKSVGLEEIKPFANVEKVLSYAEKNVIMTHKPRKAVIDLLNYYNLEKYFVEIVAGDDGFPRKPDPASYAYLHKRHHLDLAIGDRMLDIIPAQKIGLKTCLFQNPGQGADFYLNHYSEFHSKVNV